MVLSFSSELERIKDLYEEMPLQVYLQVTKGYHIVATLTQLYISSSYILSKHLCLSTKQADEISILILIPKVYLHLTSNLSLRELEAFWLIYTLFC